MSPITSTAHRTALVWLRRDLRLEDNPALEHACKNARHVVIVYVHEQPAGRDARWADGAATRWWLYRSLRALQQQISTKGGCLTIRQGPALRALLELQAETAATLLTWNRLYEPVARARDRKIEIALRKAGVTVRSFGSALLFEPDTVSTGSGTPYRVFTPFWRACLPRLAGYPAALPTPRILAPMPAQLASAQLDDLGLQPAFAWDAGLDQSWRPGARGAKAQLDSLTRDGLAGYSEARNRPDQDGTSRLSPHLHFGEISPRQILTALRQHDAADRAIREGADIFLRQILWREFAHHLLFHYPHTAYKPLDVRFSRYLWRRHAGALRAWQRGNTGYPMVDAGMRQLWHTGWMHNRVRMCTASFLTKNLRIHWLAGARWFWDTLVDADLANNTLGWQWVTGCGADAAPYYRIFNPVLQAEKFDPQRTYIRRWLPELAGLPDRWIHRPWEAPAAILNKAGVELGHDYPQPIVELQASREAALSAYGKIRQ